MCEISNELNLKFISLIFAIGLYILYVKKLLFASIIRRLTFRDACAQLGIVEEDAFDDSNGEEEEEEVGEVEDALVELQTDEEEKTAVDNEGDVEKFVEDEDVKKILLQRLREQLLNLRVRKKVLNVWSVKKFSELSFFTSIESYEKYKEISTRYAIQQACFQWTS